MTLGYWHTEVGDATAAPRRRHNDGQHCERYTQIPEGDKMFFGQRAAALSALSAAVFIGLSALSIIPANASTHSQSVTPRYAIVCGGDACIQTSAINGNYANVNAWANNTTFYGRFELSNYGCGSHWGYSTVKTWPAGGTHYTFKNIPWQGDQCGDYWRVTAEKHTSSGYTSLGSVAFQI